jgi:hypothetical protein
MKRLSFFFLFLLLVTVGAGCTKPRQEGQNVNKITTSTADVMLRLATLQDGPAAITTDATTGRRFESVLPPIFRDGNGTYTTPVEGERIHVQLAVGGSPKEDAEQFAAMAELSSLYTFKLGEWSVTTAQETGAGRWVARATHADPFGDERIYHIIECLATTKSEQAFWDGCRTMIENATISQDRTQ